MAHFAHVNPETGIVCSVIVIEQDTITGNNGWPCPSCGIFTMGDWIQTSYNTRGGEYKFGVEAKTLGEKRDKDARNRKNYAGVGYKYDKDLDAFTPPKPHKSWVIDTKTCLWQAPTPYPNDGNDYYWEEGAGWVLIEQP